MEMRFFVNRKVKETQEKLKMLIDTYVIIIYLLQALHGTRNKR